MIASKDHLWHRELVTFPDNTKKTNTNKVRTIPHNIDNNLRKQEKDVVQVVVLCTI